ncbi:unnamed protein product [Microthlaspi erraticum]|uniref:AIG1-type G domain-containing protein n=1 Tax=Microthlaspi erraticum TaxID=1685480 RepID=A0A6D2JN02_9BRAS|nr:unnamed protein product [Microthlaspi erraticum]
MAGSEFHSAPEPITNIVLVGSTGNGKAPLGTACLVKNCSSPKYGEEVLPQDVFGAYGEGGPEVMIGDGPEGDRSNRMAKQARRNRALSKRKQSA